MGVAREVFLSQKLHSGHSAVLVSSALLRRRQLGQLDLCFLDGQRLVVVEVKGHGGPGPGQRKRLAAACQWLGELLGKEVFFRVVQCESETLPLT